MALSWKATGSDPAAVRQKLVDAVAKNQFPPEASIKIEDDSILITFEYLGKSELQFSISTKNNEVVIKEEKRNIALAHKMHSKKVEEEVDGFLKKCGFNRVK